MNFFSIPFIILFVGIIILFIFARHRAVRKIILLVASVIFYAYWDWQCLLLLVGSGAITFIISHRIFTAEQKQSRYLWLIIGITQNIILLAFFKYYNFFIKSINSLFSSIGWSFQTLDILVPLGISFFAFEGLSYLIDIYRGASKPASSWLDYALFMGFFPRVVAGPIVRASQFLPQMEKGIDFIPDNCFAGIQILLRGCIKKLVIADSLALMSSLIFTSPSVFSSVTIWIGVLAYSIEIYFDFSGYTDMAVGIAKILGIELPMNFNLPYTSQSISEFWRRWHITLSAWFRDYVFYPLERNRSHRTFSVSLQYINILIVFLLTGLWHGASWNFVLWGGLYGIYLVVERVFGIGKISNKRWTSPSFSLRALITFVVVSITWVFFRSSSFETTILILQKLFFVNPTGLDWFFTPAVLATPIVLISGFFMRYVDFKKQELPIERSYSWALVLAEFLIIFFFMTTDLNPFIYFQF